MILIVINVYKKNQISWIDLMKENIYLKLCWLDANYF